eukprot:TRINITY_DN57440_c0_g1_i1.p1 TRINITY_DN57440_c0_g1~~TRINITY_DN57440_c0_g1_i1.p1  ORF type:complete len:122 (+),score=8.44 TRINITY_DN57440_c0_g1_i1:66-431(+)
MLLVLSESTKLSLKSCSIVNILSMINPKRWNSSNSKISLKTKNLEIKDKSSLLLKLMKIKSMIDQLLSSIISANKRSQQSILTELSKVVITSIISLSWFLTKPKRLQLESLIEKQLALSAN